MNRRSKREIYTTIPTFHNAYTSIQSLSNVFICCKCNKYNAIVATTFAQNCIFCGNPNYIKKK